MWYTYNWKPNQSLVIQINIIKISFDQTIKFDLFNIVSAMEIYKITVI
jgi:hypothetical protein